MNKNCVIYSQKKAKELISKGYQLTKIAPNIKYEGLVVFYFKRTPELEKELNFK